MVSDFCSCCLNRDNREAVLETGLQGACSHLS